MTTQPSCDHDKLCYANLFDDCVPSSTLTAFTFSGRRYRVNSWASLLEKVCEILITNENSLSVLHSPHFERCIVEYDPNSGQRLPQNSRRVPHANVWVLTHNSDNTLKSDNELKDAATKLLQHFGYNPMSLRFEYYSDEE